MTNKESDFITGAEHTPEKSTFGGDVYPNFLANTYGGGQTDTIKDQEHEDQVIDDFACRFECYVADGILGVREGTISMASNEDFESGQVYMKPKYPTFGGAPIGPDIEGEIAEQSISVSTPWVILHVPCGDFVEGIAIHVISEEEHGQVKELYPGFVIDIAYLNLASIQVVTGFSPSGTPQYDNRIEAESIEQYICSDIVLSQLPQCDSDSSGDSDDSGDSGDSGSSKDSAIVPVNWSPTDYVALYCVESPDVRFEDTLVIERPKGKRTWTHQSCRRFKSVLADGTLEVVSYTTDKPANVGFSINTDGLIKCTTSRNPFARPRRIVVKLTGIRRGFKGIRFEPKTKEQFDANERRLSLDIDG